jgi:uncharacterized protein YegP (UPF0339 family)
MGAARFEVVIGINNQFQFKLIGPEGNQVMVSRGFANKSDCMALIREIKEAAPAQERYERSANEGKLAFRLKAANHKILGECGPFEKEEEREAAMAIVRRSSEAAVTGV